MPTWLTIVLALGGSAIISSTVGFVFNWLVNNAKARKQRAQEIAEEIYNRDDIMRKGVQALLRNDLYELYDKCMSVGFATIDQKNNFENLYIQYHALGKNGVMDALYNDFMKLPSVKPARKKKLQEAQ